MANHNAHRNNYRQSSLPDAMVLPAHLAQLHQQLASNSVTAQTVVVGNWVLQQDPVTGVLSARWTPSGTVMQVAAPDTTPPAPQLRYAATGTLQGATGFPPLVAQLLTRVQGLPGTLDPS